MADKKICDDCGCVIVADVHKCIGPPTDKPAQSDEPSAREFKMANAEQYVMVGEIGMQFAEAYAALRTARQDKQLQRTEEAFDATSFTLMQLQFKHAEIAAKVAQLERERDAAHGVLVLEMNLRAVAVAALSEARERAQKLETFAQHKAGCNWLAEHGDGAVVDTDFGCDCGLVGASGAAGKGGTNG